MAKINCIYRRLGDREDRWSCIFVYHFPRPFIDLRICKRHVSINRVKMAHFETSKLQYGAMISIDMTGIIDF